MYIQNPKLRIGEHNARNGGAVCCVYFSEVCADQREVADRGEVVLCEGGSSCLRLAPRSVASPDKLVTFGIGIKKKDTCGRVLFAWGWSQRIKMHGTNCRPANCKLAQLACTDDISFCPIAQKTRLN